MNISLLLAAALFFPSAPALWKDGPLTDRTLKIPAAETFAPDTQLESQAALFRQLQSPFLRSGMALEFAGTRNPKAFRILLSLLRSEKDSFVQDNILQAMLSLKESGHAVPGGDEIFTRYFHAASPAARSAAAILYLTNGENADPALVVEAFKNENSIPVLNRLIKVLRPLAHKISKSQTGNLFDHAGKERDAFRAMMAELIAGQNDPDDSSLLQKAILDPDPVIRAQIARGLAGNRTAAVKLLAVAAEDNHPAVRLQAAGIVKPDTARQKYLIKMLSDPSPEVRAAAADSLGTSGNAAVAASLVKYLGDPEIAVRRAVSAALVRLKPAEAVRRLAMDTAERNPRARRQALDFLVRSNDRTREKTILHWIAESDDPQFLREAAAALGFLDCRNAADALIRLAGSKDDLIRQAAAESMGMLKLPVTYSALAGLSRDRTIAVAEAAFMSMYQIGDRVFMPEFERMTGRFSEDGANCRAIACRALVPFPLKANVIGNLTKIITQSCIRIPMGDNSPDSDHARISALLLLREKGRQGDQAAQEAYQKNLAFLDQLKPGSELRNPELEEYLRQLRESDAGKTFQPKAVDSVPAIFTAAPAGDKK